MSTNLLMSLDVIVTSATETTPLFSPYHFCIERFCKMRDIYCITASTIINGACHRADEFTGRSSPLNLSSPLPSHTPLRHILLLMQHYLCYPRLSGVTSLTSASAILCSWQIQRETSWLRPRPRLQQHFLFRAGDLHNGEIPCDWSGSDG